MENKYIKEIEEEAKEFDIPIFRTHSVGFELSKLPRTNKELIDLINKVLDDVPDYIDETIGIHESAFNKLIGLSEISIEYKIKRDIAEIRWDIDKERIKRYGILKEDNNG